jgi:hypothetical protein
VIKELNVGFAPCGEAAPAAPSEETRRADAVGLVKALLGTLEQGPAGAAAAAAEHGAGADARPESGQVVPDKVLYKIGQAVIYNSAFWILERWSHDNSGSVRWSMRNYFTDEVVHDVYQHELRTLFGR